MRARKAAIIAVTSATLSGCASSSHPYEQLPCEIRVIHVESNRANYPLPLFTGERPGVSEKAIIPGDPWSEAAKIIAQAVSDCFKWGFDAAKYQSRWAVQFGFISVDVVSIRWGQPKEIEQARMAWAANAAFMEHLPDTLPVNSRELGRRMVGETQRLQGWSDSARGGETIQDRKGEVICETFK